MTDQTIDAIWATAWKEIQKGSEVVRQMIAGDTKLFNALIAEDCSIGLNLGYGYITVGLTGDGDKLGRVWKPLRAAGYKPNCHIDQPKDYACVSWYKGKNDEGFISFSFSSTVCRRVKVGEKTVTEPVYEIRCRDAAEAAS